MPNIFYDKDADLNILNNKRIGIIGYGIQGRAQALNFRDSGLTVYIGNRKDHYHHQAIQDKFKVFPLDELVQKTDIILMLIPDQAQKNIYEKFVHPYLTSEKMLIFAHGYALRFQTVKISPDIDIAMMAPRMPGKQIRSFYLNKSGVPAFVDVVQDTSGCALKKILALSKAAGFTKAGVMQVNYRVEAELDLFVEQFLIPNIIKSIHLSFATLVKEFDFPAEATLMELYASGELAEVLKIAADEGIGRAFQKNASPTCQAGIAFEFNRALNGQADAHIKKVIESIQDGSFKKKLDDEGMQDYPTVKKLWNQVDSPTLVKTQQWIKKMIHPGKRPQ